MSQVSPDAIRVLSGVGYTANYSLQDEGVSVPLLEINLINVDQVVGLYWSNDY